MPTLIDEPEAVRAALSPVRRRLLAHLREPASAPELAAALGLSRQNVNYHLRALEAAGLVELVEERQRRGFRERVLRARPGFVIDPGLVSDDFERVADRFAADHLVGAAADAVRDVSRMQAAAEAEGTRLLTATVEVEARFASPAAVRDFTDELTALLQDLVTRYDTPRGRRHRLVAFTHPGAAR
ncbi:ArsR/SmtB family transcription factor [Phycicoccus avicenniae]|uniref:ArsR/SmtB family transcription factor n=1 Tax=Phycicoccus avicenniae TaxID=2828860 RepID=UPI003D2A2842